MYLVMTKSAIVDALQTTFNSSFVNPDFRDLHVSIEYPIEQQHYPSVWVNYDDQNSLQIAGIDYAEIVYDHPDPTDPTKPDPAYPDNPMHEVTRWTFAGEVTLTVVALTSLERDNLYDELVRLYAFSRLENATTDFRTIIENNDFVGINVNWDELRPHGDGAAPGTPWGSEDEVIYEKSLGFDIEGEFVSDPNTNTLVPLSAITITGTMLDRNSGEPLDSSQYIL